MKIAVRYQSRGGNTKAVAEVIANSLGVKAEAVDNANELELFTYSIDGEKNKICFGISGKLYIHSASAVEVINEKQAHG